MSAPVTAVRPLEAKDLDRVVGVDGAGSGRSRRGFYGKRFGAMAEDPRGVVGLAAEMEGKLAGFAFAHLLDGEFGGAAPVGVLDAIAVAPAARGSGVGAALLGKLEAALRERGAAEVRSQTEWADHGMAPFFSRSGFQLSPRLVLERALEAPLDDGFSWEELPARTLSEGDLPAIVRLDKKITGRDRGAYYRRKAAEVLRETGIRLSLVVEVDKQFAGFLMARVDYGAFGQTEPTAVLDTIGVDPGFTGRRVGRALLEQLLLNLRSLRVERVVTEVEWHDLPLVGFFARTGFRHSQRLSFTKAIG